MEEWRDVPGYPGYAVSNQNGLMNRKTRWLFKNSRLSKTTRYIKFRVSNCQTPYLALHHAVLLAFVGPRPEGMIGAHIDGDRTNNRPENLMYCSMLENMRHRDQHGNTRIGQENGQSKLTEMAVRVIRRSDLGAKILATIFNVSHSTIHQARDGTNWRWIDPEYKPAVSKQRGGAPKKLTIADVKFIRESDKTTAELAKEFGVAWNAIKSVRARLTWRHVA